jgi:hypothetical protein
MLHAGHRREFVVIQFLKRLEIPGDHVHKVVRIAKQPLGQYDLGISSTASSNALTAFLSPSFKVANTMARKLKPIFRGSRLTR